MATRLKKRVVRQTEFSFDQRRQLMVALVPGDMVEVWHKGCRKKWEVPVTAVLHLAMKMELAARKREKAAAKKARAR